MPASHRHPEDPKEPEFVDEPDLPPGEPSGAPTRGALAEPMTGAQRCYLKTLCQEAKQPFDENLTKAQAAQRIDELHRLTRHDAAAVGRDVAAGGVPRV